jgi:hypothetical protein
MYDSSASFPRGAAEPDCQLIGWDIEYSHALGVLEAQACTLAHRQPILARYNDNSIRSYTQPSHTHDLDPYDQLLTTVGMGKLDGWEKATTDKHGCSSLIAQDKPTYSVLGQSYSTSWLRHIFHTHNTPISNAVGSGAMQ